MGFNRLSIGVQSLNDDELELLDRQHSGGAPSMRCATPATPASRTSTRISSSG